MFKVLGSNEKVSFLPWKSRENRIKPIKTQFSRHETKPKVGNRCNRIPLTWRKAILSPILDLFNGEIIAYQVAKRPVYSLVSNMLDKAFAQLKEGEFPILHSDQGWHYQMKQYQHSLKKRGILQSMSRKGNCLDNAVVENFFGLLKSELLYLQDFESMEHFQQELERYIHYYNHKRIKTKLKGMSPIQYRTHAQQIA